MAMPTTTLNTAVIARMVACWLRSSLKPRQQGAESGAIPTQCGLGTIAAATSYGDEFSGYICRDVKFSAVGTKEL
jgi:hypothetical protein